MAKLMFQVLALLAAAALVVDSVVVIVGRRKRSVQIEGLPSDCQAEIDVDKRDGSGEIDFVVCAKNGDVCTSRDVPACGTSAQSCNSFDSPDDQYFAQMFPKAYAKVCVEDGVQCLYTDVEYEKCGTARTMGDNEICITLSNGEVECSEIPEEYFIQKMMMQSEEKLPEYVPHKMAENKAGEEWYGPYEGEAKAGEEWIYEDEAKARAQQWPQRRYRAHVNGKK